MKKSLILASCLLASSSVMAMDTQYFIGAGVERGTIDMKGSVDFPDHSYFNESISSKETDESLKIKMGVILDKTHRISLSNVKYSEEGEDLKLILANYDYLIPINNEFRVYVGGHIGKANYTSSDNTEYIDPNMSGLAYGAQVGTIFDITKNIEFEIGFAYTKYNVDKSESRTSSETIYGYTFNFDYNTNIELDKSTSMFAGLNYKF